MNATASRNDDGQGLQPLTVLKMAEVRVLSAAKHTLNRIAGCNQRRWCPSRWNRTTYWVEVRA